MLHTMLLATPLTRELHDELSVHFGLSAKTERRTTIFHSNNGFREITLVHVERNRFIYRGIEIILNPKMLLDRQRGVVHSTSTVEVPQIADAFNWVLPNIFGKFSWQLPEFSGWACKRIDYCVDITTEHVSEYVRLFQRCKLPNHHYKGENKLKGSAYFRSGSVNVNFYDKWDELSKRLYTEHTTVTEEHVAEAKNILRFEIQCLRGKTNYIKKQEEFEDKSIEHFLDPKLAERLVLGYYDKTIGSEEFYSLYEAEKIIGMAELQERTKEVLINTVKLIAQARGVDKARKQFAKGIFLDGVGRIKGSKETFNRNLKKLRCLNVNSVTIPRNWKIHHLSNLRDALVQNICRVPEFTETFVDAL